MIYMLNDIDRMLSQNILIDGMLSQSAFNTRATILASDTTNPQRRYASCFALAGKERDNHDVVRTCITSPRLDESLLRAEMGRTGSPIKRKKSDPRCSDQVEL